MSIASSGPKPLQNRVGDEPCGGLNPKVSLGEGSQVWHRSADRRKKIYCSLPKSRGVAPLWLHIVLLWQCRVFRIADKMNASLPDPGLSGCQQTAASSLPIRAEELSSDRRRTISNPIQSDPTSCRQQFRLKVYQLRSIPGRGLGLSFFLSFGGELFAAAALNISVNFICSFV